MPIYRVEYRTDVGFAADDIEAATPAAALEQARRTIAQRDRIMCFEPYSGAASVEEIVVENAEGDELCRWDSDDMLLRLASHELLAAARLTLDRWEQGDLAEAVRLLARAVAKADGRTRAGREGAEPIIELA